MDFARKQLIKYGWTDGKGLGKHENGISEALKPKLKRSVAGIGHDAASEFNDHWWETLYDKAANNIKVVDKKGKTETLKQGDIDFQITNSMWHLKKIIKKDKKHSINNKNKEYNKIFVKKAVLTSGGAKTEDFNKSDSSDVDGEDQIDVFKMTDEQLFAACGGRTAHKGARHGLKALGKLARIEEQEAKMLSMSKYEGYSHSKINKTKLQLNNDLDTTTEVKNKSKYIKEKHVENINEITETGKIKKHKKKKDDNFETQINMDYKNINEIKETNKKKYKLIGKNKHKKGAENTNDDSITNNNICFREENIDNNVKEIEIKLKKNKNKKRKNIIENEFKEIKETLEISKKKRKN